MNKPSLDQLRIERQPEKNSTWRWWLAIVLLGVSGLAAWMWSQRAETVVVRIAVAREAQGDNQSGGTVLNASGYVTARRQATVSSKVTGKVMDIFIEEGMNVEEGEVLATLDGSNVTAALNLAEAQVQATRTALKETQALLDEAQLNFERFSKLAGDGLASQSELDRSRAQSVSLAAQLERKEAEIRVAQRQVDIYRQEFEDTIIRAPFSGVVVAKNAQPGEMISPISAGGGFTRTGIGTIVDMSSLEIEIDVNEAYINRVKPGQRVVATLDAYPDWHIPCAVIATIPTADRQRATVGVRVGFNALDERILPDMGVKVAFQEEPAAQEESGAAASRKSVTVPASAVHHEADKDVVWVVHDNVVERRAVTAAGSNGSVGTERQIIAGLEAGEVVVTEASALLFDGIKVEEKGNE